MFNCASLTCNAAPVLYPTLKQISSVPETESYGTVQGLTKVFTFIRLLFAPRRRRRGQKHWENVKQHSKALRMIASIVMKSDTEIEWKVVDLVLGFVLQSVSQDMCCLSGHVSGIVRSPGSRQCKSARYIKGRGV